MFRQICDDAHEESHVDTECPDTASCEFNEAHDEEYEEKNEETHNGEEKEVKVPSCDPRTHELPIRVEFLVAHAR
jgi:hypothetical protein